MEVQAEKTRSLWTYLSSLGIAFTLPYIIYKVLRTLYVKNTYGNIAGKVVVITGASSGLGEALAQVFYQQGCQVVLCARRRQELDRVREKLLQNHHRGAVLHPIIEPLDLADLDTLPDHAHRILTITGHVDILINNAGISNRGAVIDTVLDVDLNVMNVNYFGTVCLIKAFLPHMIKRRQGHIVNISSVQGLIGIPDRAPYSASKHALQGFSDSLRAELAQHNINVTVVSPAYIKTNLSVNALTEDCSKYKQMDDNTQKGYDAGYVAQRVLKCVLFVKNEIVIAPLYIRAAIFLRKFLPNIFFYIMGWRAQRTMRS